MLLSGFSVTDNPSTSFPSLSSTRTNLYPFGGVLSYGISDSNSADSLSDLNGSPAISSL